jgi:hypothetical protein
LKANGHYAPILIEMPRCWRIHYANEFHLDITPSIPNPSCNSGGELVPDRAEREWKPTNPKGFRTLFLRRASLAPRIRLTKRSLAEDRARTDIEPYPGQVGFKGVLPRTIQISKRHRDVYFDRLHLDPSLTPLSVIITTLASRSYEYCVSSSIYDSELDLLCDTIRHMPAFVESRLVNGRKQWFIWNETTSGENFGEKWNKDPALAEAFFAWHGRALTDLGKLASTEGLDQLRRGLGDAFGPAPAKQALDAFTGNLSSARHAGQLVVAPAIGLSVGAAAASTPVRANTFFGR